MAAKRTAAHLGQGRRSNGAISSIVDRFNEQLRFLSSLGGASGRRCVQQASDCQPRNEIGQFIREWLVGGNAERLLREHLAIPHENPTLAHQPDGYAQGDPFLSVWG